MNGGSNVRSNWCCYPLQPRKRKDGGGLERGRTPLCYTPLILSREEVRERKSCTKSLRVIPDGSDVVGKCQVVNMVGVVFSDLKYKPCPPPPSCAVVHAEGGRLSEGLGEAARWAEKRAKRRGATKVSYSTENRFSGLLRVYERLIKVLRVYGKAWVAWLSLPGGGNGRCGRRSGKRNLGYRRQLFDRRRRNRSAFFQ